MLKRFFLLLVTLAALCATASAQQLTEEEDVVLWCGSAFFWLGANASDSGDTKEADLYQAWSETLMARGVALLKADQLNADQIAHVVDAYDNSVVAELGTPKARHDVTKCPDLLGNTN